MNDYKPALAALRERRKGKPGELWLAIGVACMAIAPFVLAIVHNEGAEFDELKQQGVVSEAQILRHSQREKHYTDRKGRDKTSTVYSVEVRYDANAKTTFADWKTNGSVAPAKYPATLTHQFDISGSYVESHPAGTSKPVVFLPGNMSSMKLAEQVEAETSFSYFLKYYLAMAALFAAGAAMTVVGWRKRKAGG